MVGLPRMTARPRGSILRFILIPLSDSTAISIPAIKNEETLSPSHVFRFPRIGTGRPIRRCRRGHRPLRPSVPTRPLQGAALFSPTLTFLLPPFRNCTARRFWEIAKLRPINLFVLVIFYSVSILFGPCFLGPLVCGSTPSAGAEHPAPGSKFCKRHTCPSCGEGKAFDARGCPDRGWTGMYQDFRPPPFARGVRAAASLS